MRTRSLLTLRQSRPSSRAPCRSYAGPSRGLVPVPCPTSSVGVPTKAWHHLGIRCFGFAPLRLPPDLDFIGMFNTASRRGTYRVGFRNSAPRPGQIPCTRRERRVSHTILAANDVCVVSNTLSVSGSGWAATCRVPPFASTSPIRRVRRLENSPARRYRDGAEILDPAQDH